MSSTLPADEAKLPEPSALSGRRQAVSAPPPAGRARTGALIDRVFGWTARAAALLTLALLLGILVSLFIGARPAIEKFGLGFFTSTVWDPVSEKFGGVVMIYGTLATSLIALLIAVPVSFGIALFLTELSPAWLKRPLGIAIELLAAVPSIVYGMWGLMVFGPILATYVQQPLQALFSGVPVLGALFSGPPVGIGLLSAGIILAIMIIPFIAAVMRDVFEVTPPMLKESAYGLGSTTWEVVLRVVLPYTKTGVIGGIMLGLGRALGETMAVTFVIGNFNQLDSISLFQPANSITSALANEFAEAQSGLHAASLIYLGLVLFFITFVVLALSKLLLMRLRRNEGTRS
ncbi:MAG: phosphate ABC transporter permease PstC [Burkholderiales bacterium]|nr:phosphate ABC transporter permease PstC [Burkholderiales bacterium]